MTQPRPLRLVIFYADKDTQFRRELEAHLVAMKQQGLVEVWSDRAIEPGQEWELSIHDALEAADILLLLISPDFLASEYIYDKELKRVMERHEARKAQVIPVFLRPCDWNGAPFGKLQGVPDNAKPISQWRNRDEAFTRVTQAVRRAAEFPGSIQVKHRPESDEKTPNASPSGQGQQTAKIFISYAKEDRDRVEPLARALAAVGWSVWWDREIPFGKPFDQVIEEALIKARCIIVIWSSHSIHSHWVREEAENGGQRNILIPILIEQVIPPFGFRRIQTADFTNWDNSQMFPEFRKLIGNITSILELTEEKAKHATENLTYELEGTLVRGKDRPVTRISKILNSKLIGIFIVAIIISLAWYTLFVFR